MRPHRRHQSGYLLLPVVITLTLLASLAYLLSHSSALHLASSRSEANTHKARYVAEAGLHHALWQTLQANCSGYPSLGNQPFGNHSYSTVISPTGGSPVSITASALLANGSRYSIRRDAVDTYETPVSQTLVLGTDPGSDVLVDQFYANQNYGNYELQVSGLPSWTRRSLLQFDLSALPGGVRLLGAELQLYQLNSLSLGGNLSAHRVTRGWVEGSGQGTGSPDGATWNTHNGNNGWSSPGGDHQAAPVASASARLTPGWVSWNIGTQVERWLDGTDPNHGLLLQTGLTSAPRFASKEHADTTLRPRLVLTYACPCDAGTASTSLVLQPDAADGADTYLDDGNPGTNWGSDTQLRISNKSNVQKRGLLRFDLSAIPPASLITSATLEMNLEGIGSGDTAAIDLHRVTRDWHQSQASWSQALNTTNWTSPGGDIDPTAITSAVIEPAGGPVQWDITALAGDWVAGNLDNHGVMLLGSPGVNHADFSSSNHATAALRPKLTIQYHCPCGAQCTLPETPSCSAVFIPDTIAGEFSTAGQSYHYNTGITPVPGGMTFNGNTVPADGGWVAVGDSGRLVLLDRMGQLLDDTFNSGLSGLEGIAYIPEGELAGKLLAVRGNHIYQIDPAQPPSTHPVGILVDFASDLRGASYIKGGSYDGYIALLDKTTGRFYIIDQAFSLVLGNEFSMQLAGPSGLGSDFEGIAHLPDTDQFLVTDLYLGYAHFYSATGIWLDGYPISGFGISKPTAAAIDPRTCAHVFGSVPDAHYWLLTSTSKNSDLRQSILLPTRDTFINEGASSTPMGTDTRLQAGTDNSNNRRATLLNFSLADLPADASLSSARLRLYAGSRTGNNNNWSLRIHSIKESWTESGATWVSRDGSHPWGNGPGGSYEPIVVASQPVADTGWYEFDITPLVQEWLDGVSPNHGVQLVTDAPKRNGLEFHAREGDNPPQLVVIYGK
ncbi:DNRLRE domain-containing protein [Oceanimonas marisflavi]|uniref:DNRLRE domain-containing protein n=1 Tax=Oceanimonas marisflavi TaxID=2059724 RepID=UPI000D2F564C|nr:DNRLRE domain-containing protein [Oceanimonas marisflavi]